MADSNDRNAKLRIPERSQKSARAIAVLGGGWLLLGIGAPNKGCVILGDELKAGRSIAEIAQANGVDSQTIINALMDEAQAYFDVAVTAGKLTAEEAAEIVARQVEPTTHYVNEPITFDNKGDKDCENGDDEGGDKLAKASVEANAVSDAVTTQPSRTTSSFLPIITR